MPRGLPVRAGLDHHPAQAARFPVALDDFDVGTVAAYGDDDIARLMADAAIVRNRAKVEAAIANARATLRLHESGRTLVDLVFAPPPPGERPAGPRSFSELPSATPSSKALAAELRGSGFRFVGPVVAYCFMQSAGVVDDHLEGVLGGPVTAGVVERDREGRPGATPGAPWVPRRQRRHDDRGAPAGRAGPHRRPGGGRCRGRPAGGGRRRGPVVVDAVSGLADPGQGTPVAPGSLFFAPRRPRASPRRSRTCSPNGASGL